MKMFVWRISRIPSFFYHVLRQKTTLLKVKQNKSQVISKLVSSIEKSIQNSIDPGEKEIINEIESIRNFWLKSNHKIHEWNKTNEFVLVSKLAKISSKSKFWSTLIFNLIREFEPKNCLEIGSCIGISAAYQSSALRMNNKGRIITLEGSPERAEIAKNNFNLLKLDNIELRVGRFEESLPKIVKEKKTFDFVFMDGNHNLNSTLEYFETIKPILSDNSIIIIDDNNYNQEMNRAWKELSNNEIVTCSIDLFVLGVLLIKKEIKQKSSYSIGIPRL